MNAIEFIKLLQGDNKEQNYSKPSEIEFFATSAGRKIIAFLSKEIRIVDEKSFELVDYNVTSNLKKNPLYKGRDLFADMERLGFSFECTSFHQDEAPVRTYFFKAK